MEVSSGEHDGKSSVHEGSNAATYKWRRLHLRYFWMCGLSDKLKKIIFSASKVGNLLEIVGIWDPESANQSKNCISPRYESQNCLHFCWKMLMQHIMEENIPKNHCSTVLGGSPELASGLIITCYRLSYEYIHPIQQRHQGCNLQDGSPRFQVGFQSPCDSSIYQLYHINTYKPQNSATALSQPNALLGPSCMFTIRLVARC